MFYFEPISDNEVVDENDDTKFLASPFVVGETYQIENWGPERINYTFAEKRGADKSLDMDIARPEKPRTYGEQ